MSPLSPHGKNIDGLLHSRTAALTRIALDQRVGSVLETRPVCRANATRIVCLAAHVVLPTLRTTHCITIIDGSTTRSNNHATHPSSNIRVKDRVRFGLAALTAPGAAEIHCAALRRRWGVGAIISTSADAGPERRSFTHTHEAHHDGRHLHAGRAKKDLGSEQRAGGGGGVRERGEEVTRERRLK